SSFNTIKRQELPADSGLHIIQRQRIITQLFLILLGVPRPRNRLRKIRLLQPRLFLYNRSSQLGGLKNPHKDFHSRVIPPPLLILRPINRGIKRQRRKQCVHITPGKVIRPNIIQADATLNQCDLKRYGIINMEVDQSPEDREATTDPLPQMSMNSSTSSGPKSSKASIKSSCTFASRSQSISTSRSP